MKAGGGDLASVKAEGRRCEGGGWGFCSGASVKAEGRRADDMGVNGVRGVRGVNGVCVV